MGVHPLQSYSPSVLLGSLSSGVPRGLLPSCVPWRRCSCNTVSFTTLPGERFQRWGEGRKEAGY